MATNNSLLETNLNLAPYFDDYQEDKQYYKILFKPSVAVQVRELNQLQTILQNQITYFGQNIFKEGTVIKGCSFSFDKNYSYVKLRDTYTNGTALNVDDLNGFYVTNQRGLSALVVNSVVGSEARDPDLNTIYVKYLNSSSTTYANGAQQLSFDSNDELRFHTSANVSQGNVLVSNTANPTGYGYAFTTTDGIVFKKGYFIYVTPQTVLVQKYNNNPDNLSIGFDAVESIVTPNSDDTLFDNAAGAPNFTAPGADRLKLEPRLLVKQSNAVNNNSFFSLVDFKGGRPVTIRQDTQFESVGREVARRTFETNGNFVVDPFKITTAPLANTADPDYATHFNTIVSRGLGYAEGFRVQFVNENTQKIRRGTDTANSTQQGVSVTFGNYVVVNELSGNFIDSSKVIQVELHNVAKTSISSKSFLSTGYSSSTRIGTAYVRGVAYNTGSQGSSEAQYRLYLFNISMNPGSKFSDVKSAIWYEGAIKGVADIVLTYDLTTNSNMAMLQNDNLTTMIYPFGQKAIKPDGFDNVEFTYRKTSNVNMLGTGSATVTLTPPVGVGDEYFSYLGLLSQPQQNDFQITPTSNGYSTNKTGTVSISTGSNTVTGSGTTFITDYVVGDLIYTSSTSRIVTSIANNTSLTVDTNYGSTASGLTHQKAFIVGNPIPFSTRPNRTLSIAANTLTINLGETPNAAFGIEVSYSVRRVNTEPVRKQYRDSVFVKIDCSNNAAGISGPWCLGIVDPLKLKGVYIDSSGAKTYSNTGANLVKNFVLDNGQRDSFYGLSYLRPSGINSSTRINANSTILVELSAFTYDTSQGVGFFTAESYPLDDANPANTSAITTQEIPTYTSTFGDFYDLRDCVDLRPYVSPTANVATTIASASINPASTLNFNQSPYLPAPDSFFEADTQFYLSRVDRISVDTSGNIVIIEGESGVNNPPSPKERVGTMTLGLVKIPPYPSLTTEEARFYNRYDNSIQIITLQNRRYTMRDISTFDNRISLLEYYTSLSLLETAAATLQVRSGLTGQTRFQNGIFVDPFNGFDFSNTKHPKFYAAIDANKSELRPAFVQVQSDFEFDANNSVNVVKKGELVMLNHTANNVLISQPYASKFRNCIEGNIFNWRGTITLDPPATLTPDTTRSADVITNIDLAQNWINLENAWGTQWGNWETLSTTYANTLISASNTVVTRIGTPPIVDRPSDGDDGDQPISNDGPAHGDDQGASSGW